MWLNNDIKRITPVAKDKKASSKELATGEILTTTVLKSSPVASSLEGQ